MGRQGIRTSRKYAPGVSSPSHPIKRCPLTALPEQLPSHLLPFPPRKSGEGEGAGGRLCTMEPPLPSAMFPTRHPPNDGDPNSHVPATQICEIWQADLLHMSGCSPARRAENSISPWQYLAVAGRTSPCLKLPKDTLATLHRIRYLRSILRFNQNSKSVNFRLSSPGFLTRNPPLLTHCSDGIAHMVQLFRPSTSRPFFRVRAVLLRLHARLHSFHSVTTLSEQRYIVPNFQTANGLCQSVASHRRLAPTIPLRGPFGHLPLPTRNPRYPIRRAGSFDDD